MYEALYDAYDAIVQQQADEKKTIQVRRNGTGDREEQQRRHLLLERKRRKLSELPALSSMMQVLVFSPNILHQYPDLT